MKATMIAVLSLGLMVAGAARAQETFNTDAPTCGGVYAAIGDTRGRLTETFTPLARTNLNEIDWAARHAKLAEGADDALRAGQLAFGTNFKVMLTSDIIDHTSKSIGTVLNLSQRCDTANGFTPSFALPAQ